MTPIPDLTAKVAPLPMGPPVVASVQVRLSGRDVDHVFALSDQVRARLAATEGTWDITGDWGVQVRSKSDQLVDAVTPYALTNPVFVDVDGRFDPPLPGGIRPLPAGGG